MELLTEFIQSSREPRELKRASAVQMVQQNYPYSQIKEVLKVSVGFISIYHTKFREEGIEGLKLKHKGFQGYLTTKQKLLPL